MVLSGCTAKPSAKPAVTEEYKRGHVDGYNAAIDYLYRMIDFTNYSYHTNLTLLNCQQEAGVEICRLVGFYGYHNLSKN